MNEHKKEILDKLDRVDKQLTLFGIKAEIVIVGGSAFILKDIITRATSDIDFLNRVSDEVSKILNLESINNRVTTFEQTFGDWEDDIQPIDIDSEFKSLTIKTISTERLLASRLFNPRRSEDLKAAFKNKKVNISQELFEKAVINIQGYSDPGYIKSFKENKDLIKEIYDERGWHETKDTKDILSWRA